MVGQESKPKRQVGIACSDCCASVECLIVAVDATTHSSVDLCLRCWNAYRQRQAFGSGCCG